jgi:hypothetical protein
MEQLHSSEQLYSMLAVFLAHAQEKYRGIVPHMACFRVLFGSCRSPTVLCTIMVSTAAQTVVMSCHAMSMRVANK